ncbi:aminotransferase class I/II-fold pyridoxal phosphate-dependent enzyme [Candidatus Saccharibacteria bacterium]|nr:aminotransferase class I/II-fold pyridoxal phosphate-dependent enzyme [Candidatus Saccharibacteria bacterium]
MKRYFLGLAAHFSKSERLRHTFAVGRKKDRKKLCQFLSQKYGGEAVLAKNGRSALAMALEAYFNPGDKILVNGFTCYAVYEAVQTARLEPIFVDIDKSTLNFNLKTLERAINKDVKGIIIQNSLGNPVDIKEIQKFAEKHNLTIIEDLAHCAGVNYPDGREAGTVGSATALSFGKDKSIDTISGGAVVFRDSCKTMKGARRISPKDFEPCLKPRLSDTMRARFYPFFGAVARKLAGVHLAGLWMRFLVKIHWVEKSADNKLDLNQKISKFEAKLALEQLEALKKSGEGPLREFYLVENRSEVMKKLKKAGFFFDGFWYEKPVSPERYYKKVNFPEESCPVAVEVSQKIINFPTYYNKKELEPARKIVQKYMEEV